MQVGRGTRVQGWSPHPRADGGRAEEADGASNATPRGGPEQTPEKGPLGQGNAGVPLLSD